MRNPRLVAGAALLALGGAAQAQIALSEGFNDVAALASAGWSFQNASSTPLGTNWFQGNPAIFTAAAGANDSYAAANFRSTLNPSGAVSNWLITPQLLLDSTSVVSLAIRAGGGDFLDRLEIRLSTTGTAPGDFSTLVGSYSSTVDQGWVASTFNLLLSQPTPAYIGFRYVVNDVSQNGNYIGIDNLVITAVPEPTTTLLLALGLAGLIARRRLAA